MRARPCARSTTTCRSLAARGLPRTGEERLPPERGRPEHYAGNRRLRSRGRIAGHVRAQAPLRRRYAFGSLPDRRAHGEPVAGGARAVPGVSRLPGGRGLDPAPCRSARQPLLEPDRGRPAAMFGVFTPYEQQLLYDWIAGDWHPLRRTGTRLRRWRSRRRRAETWTPSRSRCGASCCGYPRAGRGTPSRTDGPAPPPRTRRSPCHADVQPALEGRPCPA